MLLAGEPAQVRRRPRVLDDQLVRRDDVGDHPRRAPPEGAGRPAPVAAELARTIQKDVVRYLLSQGINVREMTILDLGAGLGGLSAELLHCGAHVIAIEPGQHWRRIAANNMRRFGGGDVVAGVGEHLPLRASSIDIATPPLDGPEPSASPNTTDAAGWPLVGAECI